ncbi:unnamed protein product [Closterium sp. Naga37s-1]|nr:unnamed protein product [Closterium sp. Naga37s-1]
MTTRNGGVRHTDTLAANSLDKTKEASVVTDASASSAVKRTSDLFTETDKDALQPGVTAQRVLEAARSLTGSAVPAATATSTDGADKPVPADGAGGNNENQEKRHATTTVTATDDEDEDDGYLSDDPEERYDASAKNEVAQRVRFAIILLIPLAFKPEVTRVQATLRALFTLWKKELKFEIQGETKFQELSVVYLNKKQYSRLQVTFERARDANFVWKHGIVHVCLDGKRISLDWQHPVDPAYVKARAADPSLVEVLFKEVDAVVTPEMLREMLVTVRLEKRGRSAFKEVQITDLTRLILKDPAVVLISTGANHEEWICVQECCEKANGVTFAQAAEHVVSQRHSDGVTAGFASRASKAGVALQAAKKEFGV